MLPIEAEDLADFIVENYNGSDAIVEVGVGAYPLVAKHVKKRLPHTKIIVTDINKDWIKRAEKEHPSLKSIYDDAFKPELRVYEGVDLIYSIRPPIEMVFELFKLASKIGSDLLIRPYLNEEGDYDYPKEHGWRLIRHRRATLYMLKRGLSP